MAEPPDERDTVVLTYLATVDGGAAPSTVARERGMELAAVISRLEKLSGRGYVTASPGGTYQLTEEGRAVLGADPDEGDASLPAWARRRPDWMQTTDVEILEALATADAETPIEELAGSVSVPAERVRTRCEELAAQGLVQPVDGDAVRLRDLGYAYVDGELEPAFLESG